MSDRTTFPDAESFDIPYADDRKHSDGFESPEDAVRGFMQRVFSARYDEALLRDAEFCRKYFSGNLRHRIATSKAQYAGRSVVQPGPYVYHPLGIGGRKAILQSWEPPTSFKVGGAHRTTIEEGAIPDVAGTYPKAITDVIYVWGKGAQYSGHERNTSVILVKESGRWFIDDLYCHNGAYESASSFYESLVR
ncbi:MAG: hypothetical protein QM496_10680 [Verrucomicrobiota bacterium]